MYKFEQPKYVSVPSLAPIDEFVRILNSAWDSRVLTHNGPLVQLLESRVNQYLNTQNTVAVTNGTIALQLAIRALNLSGEIITTPFSWIATASAIKWENCTPVLANVTGGLSGPAIRPISLRMVWETVQKVSIPVIGIGGITDSDSALQYIIAGASAIQTGTALFVDPSAPQSILMGLEKYLQSKRQIQ